MLFWGGVGLTAVLGGFTIASAVDTKAQHDAFLESSPRDAGDRDRGQGAETRTNVLVVSAAASAVLTAAIGLLFTQWRPVGAAATATARSASR